MKSERYFVLILSILLYTNLAAHFMSQIDGSPPKRRPLTEATASVFTPPLRPLTGKQCRRVEDVTVYEQQRSERRLVGKEMKESWVPCP